MISPRRPLFSSLTRISNLADTPFAVEKLSRSEWATGDYVVGEVVSRNLTAARLELPNGRMAEVAAGDWIVGALGVRAATLEAVGDWQHIPADGRMQAMTGAGLFGLVTSVSPFLPSMIELVYQGHAVRVEGKLRMRDSVPVTEPVPVPYDLPTILLVGTSMSSGKTTSARVVVRRLVKMGLRVAGVKLTGAGRYRDILTMGDAGAEALFDFVDVGLPSTVVAPEEYRVALKRLLSMIAGSGVDVVVAEAGASPLEPYNGEHAIAAIRDQIRCTLLCASDPYAAVGVIQGFGMQPHLVAGVATSTSAGMEVVRRLTGVESLNLLDPDSHSRLDEILRSRLGLA